MGEGGTEACHHTSRLTPGSTAAFLLNKAQQQRQQEEAHINEDPSRVLVGFGGLWWVFVWALVGFVGFYRVLVGFIGFYRVLSGFIWFYRVLSGFIGFYAAIFLFL